MAKTTILFNKPIFVGAAVLDISKVHMYSFHYDYMMRKYMPEEANDNFSERDNALFTERISVLFTDTDSLVYQIFTDDFYRDMKKDMEQWYDTSDYPPSHPCHSKQNTKRLSGFLKTRRMVCQFSNLSGFEPKRIRFVLRMEPQR